MPDLSERDKKSLRRLGHALKPVVMTGGAGLTSAVIAEIERALEDHELIKVRLRSGDREDRDAMIAEIRAKTRAVVIQRIGHVAVLYRPHPEKPRVLSKSKTSQT